MVDCKWAKDSDPLLSNDVVSLGREFKIESGLVEIGYNTGAKVILQGPVDLRGRIEEWRIHERRQVDRQGNHGQCEGILGPHSHRHRDRPGHGVRRRGGQAGRHNFARLPRARSGCKCSPTAESGRTPANCCAKMSRHGWTDEGQRQIVVVPAAKLAEFVREIPKRTIKTFDLVDVVAGGDGFSGRRERGHRSDLRPAKRRSVYQKNQYGRIYRGIVSSARRNIWAIGDGRFIVSRSCLLSMACSFPTEAKDRSRSIPPATHFRNVRRP